MKSNAIVRIVIFTLIIIVLISLLVGGILFKKLAFSELFSSNTVLDFDMKDGTLSSSGTVDAAAIRNLEIDWAAGSITIQPSNVNTISFSETGAKDEDDRMVWKQTGDTLVIQFCKGEVSVGGFTFGITADNSKDLTIYVPQNWQCKQLEINAAATELKVSALTIKEVDINNAAGSSDFISCTVDELLVETVSADITFEGTLEVLECESVSANCTFHLLNTPKTIEMEGVSGDLVLYLPEDAGFTAELDTVSGGFSSEFATTSQNGKHIAGDGSCRINISGVSGDIEINKN